MPNTTYAACARPNQSTFHFCSTHIVLHDTLLLNDFQCHLTFHSCLPPSRNNTVLIPALNNSSVTVCCQTAAGAGDLFWSRRAALAAAEWKCQQGFLFCHIRLRGCTHRRYHQLLWIPPQSFKIVAFHSHQAVGKKPPWRLIPSSCSRC